MSEFNTSAHYSTEFALDDTGYGLDEEESKFFKSQTGIQDEVLLKEHLLKVQAEALAIHPYPCIRNFRFTQLKISRLFAYEQLLKLGRERDGAILLDIGCCFGNDVRKAVADGFPVQNVIASDLRAEFWDLGYRLFNDSPASFPVPFIAGDAFSPSHLEPVPPFTATTPAAVPPPPLNTLTSLNPLRGHVSAIHASSFFHLFNEEQQFCLAKAVACLLSPEPGSIIFGSHVGLPKVGLRKGTSGGTRFAHSPESWEKLWDGEIFEKGTVKVEAKLRPFNDREIAGEEDPARSRHVLSWCVTRL